MEFSSLGGWVATRASGMKKNIYGNIEDLVSNKHTLNYEHLSLSLIQTLADNSSTWSNTE